MILRHTDNLSKSLQSGSMSASHAQKIAAMTIKTLQFQLPIRLSSKPAHPWSSQNFLVSLSLWRNFSIVTGKVNACAQVRRFFPYLRGLFPVIWQLTKQLRYHALGRRVAVRAKLLIDAEITIEYGNLLQKFKVPFSPITLTGAILFWRS